MKLICCHYVTGFGFELQQTIFKAGDFGGFGD